MSSGDRQVIHRIKRGGRASLVPNGVWPVWLNQHVDLWCDDEDTDYQRRMGGTTTVLVTIYPDKVTCEKCRERLKVQEVINFVKANR